MRERKIGGSITIIIYTISFWTPETKVQLRRLKIRWEKNIEIYREKKGEG
jgi:hypothetical protein